MYIAAVIQTVIHDTTVPSKWSWTFSQLFATAWTDCLQYNQFSVPKHPESRTIDLYRFVGLDLHSFCLQMSFKNGVVLKIERQLVQFVPECLEGTVQQLQHKEQHPQLTCSSMFLYFHWSEKLYIIAYCICMGKYCVVTCMSSFGRRASLPGPYTRRMSPAKCFPLHTQ